MTTASMLLGSMPVSWPISCLSLAVSSPVPVPITREAGRPDSSRTSQVITSTGFETTMKIPSNPLFIISGTMPDRTASVFLSIAFRSGTPS